MQPLKNIKAVVSYLFIDSCTSGNLNFTIILYIYTADIFDPARESRIYVHVKFDRFSLYCTLRGQIKGYNRSITP